MNKTVILAASLFAALGLSSVAAQAREHGGVYFNFGLPPLVYAPPVVVVPATPVPPPAVYTVPTPAPTCVAGWVWDYYQQKWIWACR